MGKSELNPVLQRSTNAHFHLNNSHIECSDNTVDAKQTTTKKQAVFQRNYIRILSKTFDLGFYCSIWQSGLFF